MVHLVLQDVVLTGRAERPPCELTESACDRTKGARHRLLPVPLCFPILPYFLAFLACCFCFTSCSCLASCLTSWPTLLPVPVSFPVFLPDLPCFLFLLHFLFLPYFLACCAFPPALCPGPLPVPGVRLTSSALASRFASCPAPLSLLHILPCLVSTSHSSPFLSFRSCLSSCPAALEPPMLALESRSPYTFLATSLQLVGHTSGMSSEAGAECWGPTSESLPPDVPAVC